MVLPTYTSPSGTLKPAPGFGQVQFGAVSFKPGQVTSRSAISCVPWHPKPRAERSDGPYGAPLPSGCAWVGVLAGWRLHRRMQPLRELTGRSCLNEAAQQRSEFCGPPRQRPDPGCPVAKRRGRSQQGRLFFAGRRAETRPPPSATQANIKKDSCQRRQDKRHGPKTQPTKPSPAPQTPATPAALLRSAPPR